MMNEVNQSIKINHQNATKIVGVDVWMINFLGETKKNMNFKCDKNQIDVYIVKIKINELKNTLSFINKKVKIWCGSE